MTDVRWEGLGHQEIWDSVMAGPGHTASSSAEGAWVDARVVLRIIDQRLAEATARIAGGWEGTAADATQAGLTPLGAWVLEATTAAEQAASALNAQAEQVLWARSNLPKPEAPVSEEFAPAADDTGPAPWFADDWAAADARREEAARQAVHVMQTYTSNSQSIQGALVPWSTPPTVVLVAGGPGEAMGSGGSAASGGSGLPVPAQPSSGASDPGVGGADRGAAPTAAAAAAAAHAPPGSGVLDGAAPSPGGVGSSPGGVPPGGFGPGGFGPAGVGGPGGAGPSVVAGPGRGGGPGDSGSGVLGGAGGAGPGANARPRIERPPVTRAPGAPPPGRGGSAPVVPGPPPAGRRSHPDIVHRPAGESRIPPRWGTDPTGESARPRPDNGGARPWTDPGTGRGPAAGPAGAGENPRGAGPRAAGHPGMMPLGTGAGTGAQEREHRRPGYLVDDSDAFADDRWFTPSVITPDDALPPRPRG